ncbi:MAG: alpha/beta hydrolase [Deltaproteobacteria bacterium]|nr:alpha/beta hydrolase [Deltaproteobacteria bacterium]
MSLQFEEREVQSEDGTGIGFVTFGSGPSLVLVHGSAGTRDAWLPVATAMAEQFTCHSIDRRGRGRSGDAREYSLDREREDIEAVLDVAGSGAHLLGHSFGGICALEAARRFPVGRLVLYEPPLFHSGPKSEELSVQIRSAVKSDQPDEALACFLRGGPELSTAEVSAFRATPLWKEAVELAPTFAREVDAINRLQSNLEPYREVSMPTLLLVGTVSAAHLKDASSGLQDTLPNARTVLLDGQGHVANLLVPDLVAREASDFLLASP